MNGTHSWDLVDLLNLAKQAAATAQAVQTAAPQIAVIVATTAHCHNGPSGLKAVFHSTNHGY